MTWALAGIWNYNVLNCQSLAVLSYDQRLRLLPDYLQQLEMESNGKSVDRHGKPLSHSTMPILWGGCGTNGQHAYHQLLHQGTAAFAADIVMVANDNLSLSTHRNWLNANALAQAQALAEGFEPESQQEIHKTVHGKTACFHRAVGQSRTETTGCSAGSLRAGCFAKALCGT